MLELGSSTSSDHRLAGVATDVGSSTVRGARLYRNMGAHCGEHGGEAGVVFRVWAPNAQSVSVTGDFNGWDPTAHELASAPDGSGVWSCFVPGAAHGQCYKFWIRSIYRGHVAEKADPFAFACEEAPRTASRIWDLSYRWRDAEWMQQRGRRNALNAPISIYELHLGSWRSGRDGRRHLNYAEVAEELADYVLRMGFTHVELMPLTEHPFYGSWGYQTTGYFAATPRYGTPQELMALVDRLHQSGIGVFLDWVPSHFPDDPHGLAYFDGTHLYEHADRRQGFHPEWNSLIFNYGRDEVAAFLIDSALFWLDIYHFDGLRVDGVASMLYLDYARKAGEWLANVHGGHENLEAVAFLRDLNRRIYAEHPDVQTIAEESTAWPGVSRPTCMNGLGFGMKWNLGWMHDTLRYFAHDPVHRRYHHDELTFSLCYAFNENFVLPLSHDEVVHGKGSLLSRQPGDAWQQLAGLRALFGLMWGHPGKKLLFMGDELAARAEWSHEGVLDWSLEGVEGHAGVQRWIGDLNRYYRDAPALFERDFEPEGFEWVEAHDSLESVLAFLRKPAASGHELLMVCNLTPVPRYQHRVGVPGGGYWREALNSDAPCYGGSGVGNLGGVQAADHPCHGKSHSLTLTLPPLSVVFFESPATVPPRTPGSETQHDCR